MKRRLMKLDTPGTVVLFALYLAAFVVAYAGVYVYMNGLWDLT